MFAAPEARYRVAARDPGSTPVSMTVTPGICDPVAAYTSTSVAPAGQAARKIGHEGLRASPWGSRMADTSGAMIATFIR